MPQVKGTGTWLKNVRQEAPTERVRLDYSSPHIENDRIEEENKREQDNLHLQQHRAMADRAYLIKQAKDAVRKFSQMQVLIKKNEVETFLKSRREEFKKSVEEAERAELAKQSPPGQRPQTGQPRPTTTSTTSKGSRPKSTVRRPQTAHARLYPTGVSIAQEYTGDEATFREAFLRVADPKWKSIPLPVSNGSRRPRRPKTSYKPRSRLEIRNSLMAEFQTKNAQGRTRPRTSLGLVSEDADYLQLPKAIKQGSDDEDGDEVDAEQGNPQPKPLSRKQVSTLRDVQRAMMRAKVQEMRDQQMAQERAKLQQRVKCFYQGVEDLRQRTIGDRLDVIPALRRGVYNYYN